MDDFYDDILFPEKISLRSFAGKMNSSTRRYTILSGFESRIALWASSIRTWDAGVVPRPLEEWTAIAAIFEICLGPAFGFLLRDRTEFQVPIPGQFVKGAFALVSGKIYCFQRRFNFGTRNTYKGIAKPEQGTILIWIYRGSGSWVFVADTNYTIDYPNGRITFGSGFTINDGDELAWSGQHFYPVHFDADDLDWQTVDRNPSSGLLVSGPSVPIRELRWEGMALRSPDSLGIPGPGIETAPPAPGPAPTPPPAPGGRTPATFDPTLKNTDATLSAGNKTISTGGTLVGSRGAALGNVPIMGDNSAGGTPEAGYAIEFTIVAMDQDGPLGNDYIEIGIAYNEALNGLGNPLEASSMDNTGAYFTSPSNSQFGDSSRAFNVGDVIGFLVFCDNGTHQMAAGEDEDIYPQCAIFINGTHITTGDIQGPDGSATLPLRFFTSLRAINESVSIETDIAAMIHAATYKAFRETGYAVIDADSWGD